MNETPDPSSPGKLKVLYILGSGHCGSTMLNLLMNGHRQMIGLSEIEQFDEHFEPDSDRPDYRAFYQGVRQRFEPDAGITLEELKLTPGPLRKLEDWKKSHMPAWQKHNTAILRAIQAQSGAACLVDASKSPNRLALLLDCPELDVRVVHLVRDGRAVMNSYYRKGLRKSWVLRKWIAVSLSPWMLRKRVAKDRWMRLHYEQLAGDPTKQLTKICEWAGFEFEPEMLNMHEHAHFGLGGNRMQHRKDTSIRLDEKWRKEFKLADRLRFALLGGPINAYYGYGWI